MKKYLTSFIFILLDILFLISIFYISLDIREYVEVLGLPNFSLIELREFSFVLVVLFVLMSYENLYTFRYDFWQDTQKIINSFVIGYLLVLSILALTKSNDEFSRVFITIYFFIGLLLLPVFKRLSKRVVYSFNFFKMKVFVVGSSEQTEVFKKEFDKNWYLGQVYDDENYESIVIATKGLDSKETNSYISKYMDGKSKLYIVPYITDINFSNSNILEYSNIRHNVIEIENKLLTKKNIILKYIFDKVISILILPFFLFIHLVVSFFIKSDSSGDVLFTQKRLGKDDVDFEVYKYRTMYTDSDKLLEEYLKNNPDEVIHYETFHKYKNDPRITKVGKFLRTTSLDELPQLINVLKGEMSLVGPRPYMISESCKLGEDKQFVLKVKPGITGLWQVSGRNDLTFKERNELEVWYIKNWSLWFDLVILLKTIKVVLEKVGAK